MSKIHITLVGGQPIPVYWGIVNDEDCEEIILVHSISSLREAKIIKGCCDKKCSFAECSPTDIFKIKEIAESIYKQTEGCEVTLNITSGTKPWSLIFYQTFSNHPSVQYIYIDQVNKWYNLKSGDTKELNIDIFKRFELYGNPLKKYITLDCFSESDRQAIRLIEKARRINIRAFTELTNTNNKEEEFEANEGEVFSSNGSRMKWNWSEGVIEFDLVSRNDMTLSQSVFIEMDHAKELILNTAWFELKTALELCKNPEIKELYLNCEFLSKEEKSKNEIDIIADCGTRLLFVECKTMISEITAIDKFRSAMRNFSGTSSTGIFVTNDKVFNGIRYEHYMAAMEKCKDNDIVTFNFGFWNKKEGQSLNSIINRAITQINKR